MPSNSSQFAFLSLAQGPMGSPHGEKEYQQCNTNHKQISYYGCRIKHNLSCLSHIKNDPEKIIAGKHGVIVKKGPTSGVYLPQVATETGWNREQFMNSLCGHKAGMPVDAWKKGECDIFIFTAEVFGGKE